MFPDVPTDAEHTADLREREADYTPRAVARSILSAALPFVLPPPAWTRLRILDWCAGAGVWSSELRAITFLSYAAEITAVEIDPREAEHLARHADHVRIGDWRGAIDGAHGVGMIPIPALEPFDLVVGNPPFSDFHEGIRAMLTPRGGAADYGELPEDEPPFAGAIVALCTIEALQRGQAGRELAHDFPPTMQLDIPGSIDFRGPSKPGERRSGDSRSYCAWVWGPERARPGSPWQRQLLPDFDNPAQRRWTIRPGTEC
jgi:hypothetical protein